jgi:hypothetical protein
MTFLAESGLGSFVVQTRQTALAIGLMRRAWSNFVKSSPRLTGRQLARVWFLRKNTATSPGSPELPDLERRAETETAEFLTELSRSPDLQDSQNQRAAANTLAEIADGDPTVGTHLATCARSAVLPRTRAVALEAIIAGWPHQEDLASWLTEARQSLSPDLRFVAIGGRIRQGLHTPEDREELLRLGSWEADLDFAWRDELAPALLTGWPHAPEIKAVCLSSVWGSRELDLELALRILLEGYSQDSVTSFGLGFRPLLPAD